ncbi:MAG: hypothetical protein MUF45_18445 [Spirosomaceae bacterium]|jgi:hypothetical protein|nr:hypothetical protein [Spirosomataceae bacterium]
MKKLTFGLLISVLLIASKCKDKEIIEPVEVMTSKIWKLDRFSDTDNKTLTQNQLNSQAIGLFGLEIEFRSNNVTRARDRQTKQIVNTGTWYLIENNKYIDIDAQGIKGKFELVLVQRDKLIIRAENNKQLATGQYVNLELVPSL